MGLKLELNQKQELTLSPQLLEAMQVLQMNTCDLQGFLLHELQENPVLEAERISPPSEDAEQLVRRLQWLDNQPRRRHETVSSADDPVMDFASRISAPQWEDSLEAHLILQLPPLQLDEEEERCARFLIHCVDDRGYLCDSPEELSLQLDLDVEMISRIIDRLRKLDPPGICAKDLAGCLEAQLSGRPNCEVELSIIRSHLDDMAHGRYGLIAKSLGVPLERINRACGVIRTLDPSPGSIFSGGAATVYTIPDVIAVQTEEGFDVRLNDRMLPDLSISDYYKNLMKSSDSAEVREYLLNRFQRARWLISSVEQRRTTLLSCARAIVEIQNRYFLGETDHLEPMSLADVAEKLDIHPSTVSRAIRDKYLQCGARICAFKSLFTRSLNGTSGTSTDRARVGIRRLIDAEDKQHPLSDQKLCDLLAAEGVHLSRRTIAKYREEMNIPGTLVRRQR
ncbi:MAG: RNA polymerase factor sigma-54 [Eubacteriales bacterium]|nr:RNA polymerase factor sigma-54 [Eubacteriales bacterium]